MAVQMLDMATLPQKTNKIYIKEYKIETYSKEYIDINVKFSLTKKINQRWGAL